MYAEDMKILPYRGYASLLSDNMQILHVFLHPGM